ncbi:MAG: patatin-like phospholipase family protein [Pseudomonadota bacterium]
MTINIMGQEKKIGIALSGGGFRAAAFHLGVFKKLQSMGLLSKIDLLSCVSGGSIAGGFLALNWNRPDVLDRLETYLRTKSIAVSSVLGGILDPFHTRLDKLADSYDHHLYHSGKLDDLKNGPRIYFNSTNLSTGNMFFFVSGGNKETEMGEWELGVVPAKQFPISKAVAASSAFPPVFPPLRLDHDIYPSNEVEYITLADGGVYDNLGVNPLMRKRNELDYVIVSDGGKPFDIIEEPTQAGTIVLKEAISILMEQVRGLQFKRLELKFRAENAPKPVWFSIDSKEGQAQPGDPEFASAIKTDLRKLNSAEMDVLTRHSGSLLEHRLNTYAPELLV